MLSRTLPLSHRLARLCRTSQKPDSLGSVSSIWPSSSTLKLPILRSKTWPRQAQALKVRPHPIALLPYGGTSSKPRTGLLVSLHRFVDYVPLVIDTELVRGICQDLTATLRKSFRLSDPDAADRCRDLLREPDDVQRDREDLQLRLGRLNKAEDELRVFWGP